MYFVIIVLIPALLGSIIVKLFSISKQLSNIDIDISRLELKLDDIHSELFPTNPDDSSLYSKLKLREDMCERK